MEVHKKFSELFIERLDDIERRARAIGSTITHLCRDSGVARATPDRWRKETPNTVSRMDALEEALVKAEREAEAKKTQATN